MHDHSEMVIEGVGIGALGVVDIENGKLLGNQRLGWPDVELVSYLQKEISLPIYLDNNVSAMTLAEKMFGNGKQLSDFMCIYLGHRIGAGMVLKNELYRSGLTGGGEFGHMTYIHQGKPCWCGNKGCLNQYASEQAILEELQVSTADEVLRKAVDRDEATLEVIEKAAEQIAVVLSSFINMLHLKKVVLCGTLSNPILPVKDIINKEVNQCSFLARADGIEVESSKLGENIEVIGAGGLALWYGLYNKK
ncbi:ROK family protein [Priestia megaterium]|uniref:ROK family protein n=1 Tax=Priestia megaterium TaxID=1404 RepID=UPI003CC91A15